MGAGEGSVLGGRQRVGQSRQGPAWGERTNEGFSVWVPTPWRARQQSGKEELDFSHSKQTLQQESLQKLGLGGLEVLAAESEINWTPGTWWPDFSPRP